MKNYQQLYKECEKLEGKKTTWRYGDKIMECRLCYNEGRLFICQNNIDGAHAPRKYGYKYSYVVGVAYFDSIKEMLYAYQIGLDKKFSI